MRHDRRLNAQRMDEHPSKACYSISRGATTIFSLVGGWGGGVSNIGFFPAKVASMTWQNIVNNNSAAVNVEYSVVFANLHSHRMDTKSVLIPCRVQAREWKKDEGLGKIRKDHAL